jgi:MFS family permease
MFLCGFVPVVVSLFTFARVQEPARWRERAAAATAKKLRPLSEIFSPEYRTRTLVNATLLTVAIIGLWAGAVYEPTAIVQLARKAGMDAAGAAKMVSVGTGVLSIGTILGCLALPPLAERWGRKATLALYFTGMMVTIPLAFGWAFYLEHGLVPFIAILFFMGFAGGNFAAFSLWLPEQYDTSVRATAFAFTTSVGRFIGAGVNFVLAGLVLRMGTLGTPIALTGIAFGLGILVIPFAIETRGNALPE